MNGGQQTEWIELSLRNWMGIIHNLQVYMGIKRLVFVQIIDHVLSSDKWPAPVWSKCSQVEHSVNINILQITKSVWKAINYYFVYLML